MANSGPNTNGAEFFICFGPAHHLDGKHTVFGRVIHGFEICKVAEAVPTNEGNVPALPIVISASGELS